MTKPTFKPTSIGNLGDTMVAILATEDGVLGAIATELQRIHNERDLTKHIDFLDNIDVLLRQGLRRHLAQTFAAQLRATHVERLYLCGVINAALDALTRRGVFGSNGEHDPRGPRTVASS